MQLDGGVLLSGVLPEAFGGAVVRYRKLDLRGLWLDPAWVLLMFLC